VPSSLKRRLPPSPSTLQRRGTSCLSGMRRRSAAGVNPSSGRRRTLDRRHRSARQVLQSLTRISARRIPHSPVRQGGGASRDAWRRAMPLALSRAWRLDSMCGIASSVVLLRGLGGMPSLPGRLVVLLCLCLLPACGGCCRLRLTTTSAIRQRLTWRVSLSRQNDFLHL